MSKEIPKAEDNSSTKDDRSDSSRPKELTEEQILKMYSPGPSGSSSFSRIEVF